MSKVVSLRLKDEQVDRLQRAARHLGRSPSEAAALLLEEALRQREFAFLDFRDSPVGRQAYLMGTRLAIWQVVAIARDLGGDADATADHLGLTSVRVAAALNYAAAFPEEIEAAIVDNARVAGDITRLIPAVEIVNFNAPAP